jgi:hypothetical protein
MIHIPIGIPWPVDVTSEHGHKTTYTGDTLTRMSHDQDAGAAAAGQGENDEEAAARRSSSWTEAAEAAMVL